MKAVSHDIIRWLPYLRRHAHALTGSRERGDSYVMACLSVIVAEPDRLDTRGDIRFGLFRLFHTIWKMIDSGYPDSGSDPTVDQLALCQGLAELPPQGRQVLLLRVMEGFSERETALIADLPQTTVADLLGAARAQIRGELQYLMPVDFYRQPQPRRAARQPVRRPVSPAARQPHTAKTDVQPGSRPWLGWPG